jgi:hypothetical protein
MRGVEHHRLAASGSRLSFQCLHQQLADASAAEPLVDDEARDLAAGLVVFDEVLHVENAEPRDFSVQFGDSKPGRPVARDSLDRSAACSGVDG